MQRPLRLPRISAALLALSLALAPRSGMAASDVSPLIGGAFERHVSVSLNNLALREAIRLVAEKGGLNVVVEEDLKQTVNMELKDVRLGDALESLFTVGGLQAFWRGNVFAVIGRKSAFDRGLLAANARVFKLRYASATRVAEFLNSSALTRAYSGTIVTERNANTQTFELAKADPQTNTLLVFGAPAEIALAERTISAIDQPLKRQVYFLNHANAVQVSSIINATLFNNGNKGSEAQQVRADAETVAEGQGANAGGAGVEHTSGASNIRSRTAQTLNIPVEAKHAYAVPDSRTNSVIVSGSPEAIAQANELIPQLDKKARQVAIEVEVIETNTSDAMDLGVMLNGQQNSIQSGFDSSQAAQPGLSISYDSTLINTTAFRAKLNALVTDRRAKVLAHPTVLASDRSESQINIVDEVIKGTKISNQNITVGNQPVVVFEPIYGSAGVSLNILPSIGLDGTVTLRLHPSISTIRETQKDTLNNTISLLSRRELMAQQVTVKSGGTLSLGGLVQSTQVSSRKKLPILGDIPFLGFLFSTTSTQQTQTELLIVMTPKILPD